jgi:hypothetical protein
MIHDFLFSLLVVSRDSSWQIIDLISSFSPKHSCKTKPCKVSSLGYDVAPRNFIVRHDTERTPRYIAPVERPDRHSHTHCHILHRYHGA